MESECGVHITEYIIQSPNAGKYEPEKTPYLDAFWTLFWRLYRLQGHNLLPVKDTRNS